MIRHPIHYQAHNAGGSTFRGATAKAIVIKPIESVFKKTEAASHLQKPRPVSQLGFHSKLAAKPDQSKRDRSANYRKGLFQLELEKSNKENMPQLNESWLVSKPPKTERFSHINRKPEQPKLLEAVCWPSGLAPTTTCFTAEVQHSQESLLISHGVEDFRQAAETGMSPSFNWRAA